MALNIDTSRAIRTLDEREALVRAIEQSSKADETNWLETKSSLDLATTEGKFTIAKAILGMANRAVDVAKQHCDGCAYVVVGADHDGIHGVTQVDHADLSQGLKTYVGSGEDAPRWSPDYVEIDGKSVLVITIEAPAPGHRTRTLRKGFKNFKAGTPFVRGIAETDVATPEEVRMLEDRFVTGQAADSVDFDLVPVFSGPFQRFRDLDDGAIFEEWASEQRAGLMAEVPVASADVGANPIYAAGGRTDAYRIAMYKDAVEVWLAECGERFPRHLRRTIIEMDSNKLSLRLTNKLHRAAVDVRVRAYVPAVMAEVLDWVPDNSRFSDPPPISDLFDHLISRPRVDDFNVDDVRISSPWHVGSTSVVTDGDDYKVEWRFRDVHGGDTLTGDPVTVIPQSDQPVQIRWVITATEPAGIQSGAFELPVRHGNAEDSEQP